MVVPAIGPPANSGARERIWSVCHGCSSTCACSVADNGVVLSQIRLETPTRPRSCRCPASRRSVRVSAFRPAAAAPASSATAVEWPSSHGLFRSARSPKTQATGTRSARSTRRTGSGSRSRPLRGRRGRRCRRAGRPKTPDQPGSRWLPARRRTSSSARAGSPEVNEVATEATCTIRVRGGTASPATAGGRSRPTCTSRVRVPPAQSAGARAGRRVAGHLAGRTGPTVSTSARAECGAITRARDRPVASRPRDEYRHRSPG